MSSSFSGSTSLLSQNAAGQCSSASSSQLFFLRGRLSRVLSFTITHGKIVQVDVIADRARRDVLKVHPRSDPRRPLTGVFATRSPDRPNPLGLHRVTVRRVVNNRLQIGPIEAIDGTPSLISNRCFLGCA